MPGAPKFCGSYGLSGSPRFPSGKAVGKVTPVIGERRFLHVILPHSPFVWDSYCQFAPKSSPAEQYLCAAKLMGEIVAELKRLGRYDNSLIIFQSDHGHDRATQSHGTPTIETIPADIAKQVESVNSNYSALGLWGGSMPCSP